MTSQRVSWEANEKESATNFGSCLRNLGYQKIEAVDGVFTNETSSGPALNVFALIQENVCEIVQKLENVINER